MRWLAILAAVGYLQKSKINSFLLQHNDPKLSNLILDEQYSSVYNGTTLPKITVFDLSNTQTIISIGGTWSVYVMWQNLKFHCVNHESVDVAVHHGFYMMASQFSNTLKAVTSNRKNKEILFVGHSVGAALSCLSAFILKQNDQTLNLSVVGFGSPAIGNVQFGALYRSYGIPTTLYANKYDPVCYILQQLHINWLRKTAVGFLQKWLLRHPNKAFEYDHIVSQTVIEPKSHKETCFGHFFYYDIYFGNAPLVEWFI